MLNVKKIQKTEARKRVLRRYLIEKYRDAGADFSEAFDLAYPLVEKGGIKLLLEVIKAVLKII